MKKFMISIAILSFLSCCTGPKPGEIRAPGIIDGEVITIKSLVTGKIEQIHIKEGDPVTQDQDMISINSEKIQNQINELTISQKEIKLNIQKQEKKLKLIRANQKYLKKQVQRFQRLREKKSISGEKLESMQLKLLEAETSRFYIQRTISSLNVQIEKMQNKKEYFQLILQDHSIKSPIDGVIMEKFISAGENVFPNSPLVDILDTTSMYVEVFIEESEIAALTLNQKARILIDGMEHKNLFGRIGFFGKKAEFSPKYVISEKERKSLLYRVKITITSDPEFFKIGMPVTVILTK